MSALFERHKIVHEVHWKGRREKCVHSHKKIKNNKRLNQVGIALDFLMQNNIHLNLPIRLKCENISPPGTYSITMYKLELS